MIFICASVWEMEKAAKYRLAKLMLMTCELNWAPCKHKHTQKTVSLDMWGEKELAAKYGKCNNKSHRQNDKLNENETEKKCAQNRIRQKTRIWTMWQVFFHVILLLFFWCCCSAMWLWAKTHIKCDVPVTQWHTQFWKLEQFTEGI